MATIDQSGKTEFEMTNGDEHEINVRRTGYYRLKIGDSDQGAPNFNGETINVTQRGDSLTDLGAVGAFEDHVVHLIAGSPIRFVPTGPVTSVRVFLIKEKSDHAR